MRRDRSLAILFMLVVIGALLGSVVGEALAATVPVLARAVSVGVQPTVIDLFVLRFTLGMTMKLNLASAAGILVALLVFRRT